MGLFEKEKREVIDKLKECGVPETQAEKVADVMATADISRSDVVNS